MSLEETEREINAELDRALVLLKKIFGFEIVRPRLCIGNQHSSQFIPISSLKDFARSALVQMAYDDEINGIFVPDRLIYPSSCPETSKAHRIYCFFHECVHSFLSRKNPRLKPKAIIALYSSNVKSEMEKGEVYAAFQEGLADYIAIQACQQSGDSYLFKKGQEEHETLTGSLKEWLSSKEFALLAKVYCLEPSEWEKVVLKYLQKNSGVLGSYQRYVWGYRFFSLIQPDVHRIMKMIALPPWKIQHLLWPEKYLKVLNSSKKAERT